MPDTRTLMTIVESAGRGELSHRDLLMPKDTDQPVRISGAVFHATPEGRLPSIMLRGLEPKAENWQDEFPPRIYLASSEDRAVKIAFQLRKAMVHHGVQK